MQPFIMLEVQAVQGEQAVPVEQVVPVALGGQEVQGALEA
jgi:hypothetical protein